MIDWDKELADVLKDPVFADVKPIQHRASSSDRLVRSFDEITAFVESNGRKPSADGNMSEKMLYKRLEVCNYYAVVIYSGLQLRNFG